MESPPRRKLLSLPRDASPSLKRDHDSIEDLMDLERPFSIPPFFEDSLRGNVTDPEPPRQSENPSMNNGARTPKRSPVGSSTGSLTDPGSATPSLQMSPKLASNRTPSASRTPSAFAALSGSAPPPAKKVKLTYAEKEEKRIMKEIRDKEKAEERAKKEAEKAALAEEKAKKEAEREAERRKRDTERDAKRHAQEAERAEKEEKRRKREEEKVKAEEEKKRKEEEKKRKEEEKRKGERSQMKLGNFFVLGPPSKPKDRSISPLPNPQGVVASPAAIATPSKPEQTFYEKLFLEFFCHEDVTVAPINRFERDEDSTKLVEETISSHLCGQRSLERQPFDATSLLHLPSDDVVLRGKRYMPVREIMSELNGKPTRPIDLTTDSQNSQIKRTSDLLRKIPLKFLKFQEDVRPPYRGTYTSRPTCGARKLARRPTMRALTTTDYDYDSEAEWVEDEDAEDLDSEGEEDEEGPEDGEDMEGFLDDEGDEILNSKRVVLQGDLEPISTGLCWEDRKKRSTNVKMMRYRMEVILDPTLKSIDPFSTEYWKPIPAIPMNPPPRLPLSAMKTSAANINGNGPSLTSFFAPPSFADTVAVKTSTPSHTTTTASSAMKSSFAVIVPSAAPPHNLANPTKAAKVSTANDKILPAEDLERFKAEVAGSDLSKVGLIEVLKKKFPGRKGAVIKKTLEVVARRVGGKEVDKRWVIVDGEA